jgi:hypothetical protein
MDMLYTSSLPSYVGSAEGQCMSGHPYPEEGFSELRRIQPSTLDQILISQHTQWLMLQKQEP